MNIKDYWKSIRRTAAELDPEAAKLDAEETEASERVNVQRSQKEIYLISIQNDAVGNVGGRVVTAHPWNAARMIKETTHVLADKHQIEAYKAELLQRKVDINQQEVERKGPPPQLVISQDVIAAAVKQQARQAPQRPSGE